MQQDLVAGTTLNFLTSVLDYPATAGWTLKYYLVRRGAAGAITISASTEGADYRVQVPAATTASWAADSYAWESRVEKGAEKYPIDSGQIVIRPDITAQSGSFDSRSVAERAYEDARAAYAAFNGTKSRYKIGEREIWFSTAADIVQQINYWALELKRERRHKALAEGRPDPSKVYVRLNRE